MRFLPALLGCLLVAGCGARAHVRPLVPDAQGADATAAPEGTAGLSLEAFMARVRKSSLDAPADGSAVRTLETSDPVLAAALAGAIASPGPATLRAVAREYRRLGVVDRAFQYLDRAVALDDTDAASHDELARLYRDSGFPHLGLAEAYRAVYFAPLSASARNTLGTLLQAMGHPRLAREEYERAVELDPSAAYALNNLCYAWVAEGDPLQAIDACEQALQIRPDFPAARNNLGLALAAAGRSGDAQEAFARSGNRAAALYNTGMVHLAQGRYDSAVEAFRAAHALRPDWPHARARAAQALAASRAAKEPTPRQ